MIPHIRAIFVLGLLLFLTGCPALLSALTAASQGAQWLSSAVDVASAGSDAYFARHPHPENEPAVDRAVRNARRSVAALNALLSAGDSAADQDVEQAKKDALAAYGELRELLSGLGVLSGVAPPGGAETSAPMPEPFTLPTRDDIADRL
ncbi:MAG: hypothetical protein V3W41_22150 [Planctomycetota bacterium]